ncbi:MAG: metalloregulator ArsR/SmtB family transcription factor [Gammaproteobacteria bacterium]|nr:MAG: metalloregulator ArsR/SmtB family transcription factor [Gammaproteobacteria bacterium]
MPISPTVQLLKAAADPSRLRLLALLATGEATVGELVQVLGQSQPRVSRHLRVLSEARLVESFRDGQSVYYRLAAAGPVVELAGGVVALARDGDALMAADQARLAGIRRSRERFALAAPEGPRHRADAAGVLPAETDLRDALDDALGRGPLGNLLDIGAGAGVVLRLLAPRAKSAVGLDHSKAMRVLARSRLQEAGCGQCTIRSGDMHELPFADLAFDVVVLDQVLSRSDRPLVALREALRVLRPAGQLLILDRVLPPALRLSRRSPQRALFENQLQAMLRGLGLRCGRTVWLPGRAPEHALIVATLSVPSLRTGTDDQ